MRQIQLDWSRLLGFDQATPNTDVLREAAKVGLKPCRSYQEFSAPLAAKVGSKDPDLNV